MKFAPHFTAELAEQRLKAEQVKAAQSQDEQLKELQAERAALRERGLRLGKRVTGWHKAIRHDEYYKISKVAELPMLTPDDYALHAQVHFHPPLIGSGGKNLGHDETLVVFRLHDPESGANTRFHELAQFDRNGWLRYADPGVEDGYLMNIEPGDPKLRAVRQLLDVLEVADFCLPE